MKIEKTTDKYSFYEDGVNYILDFGNINKGEGTTTEFLITGLDNSQLLTFKGSCGCIVIDKRIVDVNTQVMKLTYTQCENKIAKVAEIKYNNVKLGLIKIIGTCR